MISLSTCKSRGLSQRSSLPCPEARLPAKYVSSSSRFRSSEGVSSHPPKVNRELYSALVSDKETFEGEYDREKRSKSFKNRGKLYFLIHE